MTSVSIIVPVHNRASLTKQCLDTVLADVERNDDVEIIVVDDASSDMTRRLLESYGDRVRGITHTFNTGFARSCNDGAAVASGDYLVLLNNDCVPDRGWLAALVGYAEAHPAAAVIGAKLLFPNQTIQHAGVVIDQNRFPRHVYLGFPADHPAVNHSRRFQIVTGACCLIRHAVFEELGGFDLAFVNGWEDVDFCLRAGALGHEIHYCHESVLTHLESVSRDTTSPNEWANQRLYAVRWRERVEPDDLGYYLEDKLIQLRYARDFPIVIQIAPELATVGNVERERLTDRMLMDRARQVRELLNENIRLRLAVGEHDLRDAANEPVLSAPVDAAPALVVEGVPWATVEGPIDHLISVVMVTDNNAATVAPIVASLKRQTVPAMVELVAVDLGSTDGTVELLAEAGATVLVADPRRYGSARARTDALRSASGVAVVAIDAELQPPTGEWLAPLIQALENDPELAAIACRLLPAVDVDALAYRRAIRSAQSSASSTTYTATSVADRSEDGEAVAPGFHLSATVIRSSILQRHPMNAGANGIAVQGWAERVLIGGHRLAFDGSTTFRVRTTWTLHEAFAQGLTRGRRHWRDANRSMTDDEVIARIAALSWSDGRYLAETCGFGAAELERWQLKATVLRAAQVLGEWLSAGDRANGAASAPTLLSRFSDAVVPANGRTERTTGDHRTS